MRIFGLDIRKASSLQTVRENRGGWIRSIYESYSGAWQQNVEVKLDSVLTHHAVFSCVSLISSDIAKLRWHHLREDEGGIWVPASSPSVRKVLMKPNRNQNRIQFIESWVQSKMINGNTYVYKERDRRRKVVALYVLDPALVLPLVAEDGQVFYQLGRDNMGGLQDDQVTVPASEIIHDRWNTIHHPLVGNSPIYANGLAATQGIEIQNNSSRFFANDSRPSGFLTAPGAISDDAAGRLKSTWEENYSGSNYGKFAVLGDGLEYKPIHMSAADSQLIEQLRWSAEVVCGVFRVPTYKIGVGQDPTYDNISALNSQYYSQCLQIHIESIEDLMVEHLDLESGFKIEFDLRDLLRMDPMAQIEADGLAVDKGIMSPDEARKGMNLGPVPGGKYPYLQQQNFSLEALSRRDAQPDENLEPTEAQQEEALLAVEEELMNV